MSSKRPQPPSPSDDNLTSPTSGGNKRARNRRNDMPSVNWGDWLKSTGSAVDQEQERIDRQRA
ncbi:hypothetical protein THAOC_20993, partial [Thalassiosira oceanica]